MTTLPATLPALDHYTQQAVLGDLWRRPGLTPRDRSIVTVAALIARNDTADMAAQFHRALDNGVTPAELSETIVHLAFYAGWGYGLSASAIAAPVFAVRGIPASALPAAQVALLPLDAAADAPRAAGVEQNAGTVSPGLAHFTNGVLFRDLWRRPGLAPRDRSLVTFSALVATGQAAQITYHLNRALDSGLTAAEAGEALAQLAFYAGWPYVFTALPVVKDVLARRPA